MSSSTGLLRLRKEFKELQKKPVDNIRAAPKESNILEWHYTIQGAKKSPYEGGCYHGIVLFPSEYPFKPPSIQMLTPNGRFKTKTRLCLSMSDFHPESWNPMWSIGTILLGLYSFMLEETPTLGSIVTSDAQRRIYAKESLEFNIKNKDFCELFPDLVELHKQNKKLAAATAASEANRITSVITPSNTALSGLQESTSWAAIVGLLAAIIAFTWAILTLAL
mmetsp:Transcript_9134/g.12627  ORF Transcript_9134/g.12627 Transcript_9134/m.12627 type:complete len:221 (+) Transcript_9134:3-665(+)|eukprot:CAMPEP_0170113208 /NCGR_PEP_ID=MMETSP0020_2-20130122/9716_1 /TAXON_ID=98059 /ORGANISM="Dinobryon sp., Strain UTEXLB2267" /LENGTH=220 /DNA_ID=CAMNT_0010339449 /DNA_START=1 /DNA_END=666 /DNA_ORIENTATION=+